MKHIKTPLEFVHDDPGIGLVYDAANKEILAVYADDLDMVGQELVQAVNAHDTLLAALKTWVAWAEQAVNTHDALVAALRRAEQTFRNLANGGGIAHMGTSMEIAHNELANMRAALALAGGDDVA